MTQEIHQLCARLTDMILREGHPGINQWGNVGSEGRTWFVSKGMLVVEWPNEYGGTYSECLSLSSVRDYPYWDQWEDSRQRYRDTRFVENRIELPY